MLQQQFQKTRFQTVVKNYKEQYSQLSHLVGPLYSQFPNSVVRYGSACAIAPRIIITCTHNLFNDKSREEFCKQTTFFPNPPNGEYTKQLRQHVSQMNNFYFCEPLTKYYESEPTREEIAFVVLAEPLNIPEKYYVKIGIIDQSDRYKQIIINGFPRKKIAMDQKEIFLNNALILRSETQGSIYLHSNTTEVHQVSYTNHTEQGMSGGVGFMPDGGGGYKIVSLHTHEGQKGFFNRGIQFGSEWMAFKMNQLLKRLTKTHNIPFGDYFTQQFNHILGRRDSSNALINTVRLSLWQSQQKQIQICQKDQQEFQYLGYRDSLVENQLSQKLCISYSLPEVKPIREKKKSIKRVEEQKVYASQLKCQQINLIEFLQEYQSKPKDAKDLFDKPKDVNDSFKQQEDRFVQNKKMQQDNLG